jgi:hypothetical protein
MKWCVNLRLGSEYKCGILLSYRSLQARNVVNILWNLWGCRVVQQMGLAEIKLDRRSRKSKIMGLMVEYWQRIVFGYRRAGEVRAGTQATGA